MSRMNEIYPLVLAFRRYRELYSNDGADYSATDLIKPPRIVLLEARHKKEINAKPIQVEDLLDSFLGSSLHLMLSSLLKDEKGLVVESRISTMVKTKYGKRVISGCPDLIDMKNLTLYDYKLTSVWKRIFGETVEWEQQLNTYCYLIRQHYMKNIKQLYIVAWMKDWSERDKQFRQEPNYPTERVQLLPIRLWSDGYREKYIQEKVSKLIAAEKCTNDKLPYCTPEDMWERGGGFAVMPWKKRPRKRGPKALRILPTRELAEQWMESYGPPPKGVEWVIEERRAVRMRCERYCQVRDWCSQYREWTEANETKA